MSIHSPIAQDIPHSPAGGRFELGAAEKVAAIRARLIELARRDTTTVQGVVEFWIGEDAAVEDAGDR